METEKLLIDPEILKTKCYAICDEYNTDKIYIDRLIDEIDNSAEIDAVEVVHGRWEHSESMVLSAKCSKCKGWVTKHSVNEPDFNYCPKLRRKDGFGGVIIMNNSTIKRFDLTIKLRGDHVYDLYFNDEWVASRGSYENILDEAKKIIEQDYLNS